MVLSISLTVLAIIFVVAGLRAKNKGHDFMAVETTNVAALVRDASDIEKELGAGSFSKQVELAGTVDAERPLVSELSKASCVWYKTRIAREYEETVNETDANGAVKTVTKRNSEILVSNDQRLPFLMRDATGSIRIVPDEAVIEGRCAVSTFEAGEGSYTSPYGRRFSDLLAHASRAGRRTLGYKYEEWILPVAAQVYVLGEASDAGGGLHIKKAADKGARFIISTQSKQQHAAAAKKSSTTLTVLAIVCAVLALASIAARLLHAA